MIFVAVYGSNYDHIAKNAEESRNAFVDRVRNFFNDTMSVGAEHINFLFFTAVQLRLAHAEDFLIEVSGISADHERIAMKIANIASNKFSYRDYAGHDSWDVIRHVVCVVKPLNQNLQTLFSTKK